jgi:excisionase family DNA binding protein
MELLRVSRAARRLGIHLMALRQWALDGTILFTWVGRERRSSLVDVENMERGSDSSITRARLELLSGPCSGEGRAG